MMGTNQWAKLLMGTVSHAFLATPARYHQHKHNGGQPEGLDMGKIFMRMVTGLTVIVVGSQLAIAAPKEADSPSADLAKGKRIFAQYCVGCHGPEGRGDGYLLLGPDPANLTRPATKTKPDVALLQTIHEGKPNMPSWKVRLSENESRAVLAYIRTLAK
jgi:mono/diheme cytochrome c family protein